MKTVLRVFTVCVFVFLYAPVMLLIFASFNAGTNLSIFSGFTLHNYAELFADGDLIRLMLNSVLVSVLSALIATVLGTAAAIGIFRMRKPMRKLVLQVTNVPMTNPDIVTGISLSLLFAFVGRVIKTESILGFGTLLIAHITFSLPYVILSVMPKLRQLNPCLNEAAQDLGCSPLTVIKKVVFPLSFPGIATGITMTFVPCVSTFIISRLLGGSDCYLIGDLIEMQFLGNAYNVNLGAAISLVLMVIILLIMTIMNQFDNDDGAVLL